MIEFTCPSCGKQLKVHDDLAGKKGKCPGCGTMMFIPQPEPQAPSPIPAQAAPESTLLSLAEEESADGETEKAFAKPDRDWSQRRMPLRAPSSRRKYVVFGILAAVVLVALSIGGTVILMQRNPEPQPLGATTTPTPSPTPVQGSEAVTPNVSALTPIPESRVGSIVGGAWVIKGDGASDLLRGFTVYLCRAQVRKQEVAGFLNDLQSNLTRCAAIDRKSANESGHGEDFSKSLAGHAKLLEGSSESCAHLLAGPAEISTQKIVSLIDVLESSEAPDFDYLIIGTIGRRGSLLPKVSVATATTGIDAKYHFEGILPGDYVVYGFSKTKLSAIEWCVPVSVRAGQEVKLDLFNDNASRICNKHD